MHNFFSLKETYELDKDSGQFKERKWKGTQGTQTRGKSAPRQLQFSAGGRLSGSDLSKSMDSIPTRPKTSRGPGRQRPHTGKLYYTYDADGRRIPVRKKVSKQ